MKVPATLTQADPRSQLLYRKLAAKAASFRASARGPAIKLFCIECMGHNKAEAKACDNSRCPLWQVSNPLLKRTLETTTNGYARIAELESPAAP